MTAEEVAAVFQVAESTVITWAREKRVPAVQVPGGKGYRFRRDDIRQLIEREHAS